MKTREIEVVSRSDGDKVPATLLLCGECSGEEFLVYVIDDHPHLQCVACGETYCQAHTCDKIKNDL